jgi:two-component system sensor histidine kinase MprB
VLTAAVVSVAVVVCCSLSWFFAREQMINQVDQTLKQSWAGTPQTASPALLHQIQVWCEAVPGPYDHSKTTPTIIGADGQYCPKGDPRAVKPLAQDIAVAASGTTGDQAATSASSHNGRTQEDTSVRVYTVSLGPGYTLYGQPTNLAVSFAQPLQPVQRALARLALIMFLVAMIVIATAIGLALWVARAALKPVDKLTAAVEHIARTEEVGTTIEVTGDDEIARLSLSFNSMSTALASSRERQSQLIADAGHELRTPLTSLRTNVDLLVRSQDTGRPLPLETHTRLLRSMKAQMGELSTLIGDLLELSRPSRPKDGKPMEVVALHDIAARALDRARLRGPGLEFKVDIRPWYVRADAHALERAVINLLDNAVKFSPPGGTIAVGLHFGTLTVRDQGPGIPEEDLPHVFERFWRSPAARQMPGSGLGLAIVAQTVLEYGGEVSLSNATPGTLATMTLPGAATPPPKLPTSL